MAPADPSARSRRLAALLAGRPRWVLACCLAVSVAALLPAARLHVDSDLSALLPAGAPAAADYRTFLRTFGGFEKVFVLVRSPRPAARGAADPGALEDAAAALAAELRGAPEVAEARAGRTAEDERFFLHEIAPRLPLLLAGLPGAAPGATAAAPAGGWRADLARHLTPDAIHVRVQWMRQTLAAPGGSALSQLFAGDPLGLSEGLLNAAAAAIPMDPLSGAFLSRRGDAALVILTPARAEIDPAGGRALLARLAAAYARVRAASPVPLDFQAVGGPIYAAQDEGILRADLTRTSSTTLAGVTLVLVAGFEGALLPAAVLLAVVAGLVWAAALAGLAMPALTVVGVGFAAALIGMGVDYGIHGGAQYRVLRLAGQPASEALTGTLRSTGPGILTGAAATAAGLGALALAHFRPLREIGIVLALGVACTLLATLVVSSAVAAGGLAAPAPPRLWARWGLPALRWTARAAARRPWVVLTAAAALSAAAAWGLARSTLSTDLRALRPADAPTSAAERQLVESFSLGLDTLSVVIPGRDLAQALDRAAAAARLLRERLGPAADVTSPSDWLVEGARRQRRLAELRQLPLGRAADDLERELSAAGFRLAPFAPALGALRALGRGEDPGAPPAAAWPSWMSELVKTGAAGAVVAVHARLPQVAGSALPAGLAGDLTRLAPGSALASVARVGAELRQLALADLVRSSAVALVLVAAVVLVSFRGRAGLAALCFLPLVLGCLWTFGLWGALGRPLDLLGIFVVPLLVGTGIDIGAYAVHWRRLHPERGWTGSIEDVGLAMTMAAATTAVGFGSLASSRVPGLANDGILVACGMTACLAAALVVLPALDGLQRRPGAGGRAACETATLNPPRAQDEGASR